MNKISIAIIDDESLVRLGIKSSVEWENYGYEIIGEADNGQNGLEMIQQKQPDIVLLDICMPVMDGIEVLKRLQQMEIDCKVIILSCHDDFHFVKEAMKNGAYDYLRKNEINSANILNILEEVRQSVREERKNKEASEERGMGRLLAAQLATAPGYRRNRGGRTFSSGEPAAYSRGRTLLCCFWC